MTQAHYRLTAEEFLTLNSKLTNAELRVYLYLKTVDPFGDRKVEISTSVIADALGIVVRTVQRALKRLSSDDLKLIVWEKVKSMCQVFKKLTGDTSAAETTPVTRQEDRPDDTSAAETTPVSPERHQCRQQVVKPKPKGKSGTPQTIQTLSNYSNKDDFEQDETSEEYMRFRSLESRWRLLPHDRHVIQYELEQNPDWAIGISADGKKLVRLK
jgi:hypothetical protein